MQARVWLCLWYPQTMPRLLTLALGLCALPCLAEAEEAKPLPTVPGVTVTLWPKGAMPGQSVPGPERTLPARGDEVVRLTDVSEPSFTVYKATATKPTPAVIICPGGGYGGLAYNKEGTEVAAWLNTLGITGVVLTPDRSPATGVFVQVAGGADQPRIRARSGAGGRFELLGVTEAMGEVELFTIVASYNWYHPDARLGASPTARARAVWAAFSMMITAPAIGRKTLRLPKMSGGHFCRPMRHWSKRGLISHGARWNATLN